MRPSPVNLSRIRYRLPSRHLSIPNRIYGRTTTQSESVTTTIPITSFRPHYYPNIPQSSRAFHSSSIWRKDPIPKDQDPQESVKEEPKKPDETTQEESTKSTAEEEAKSESSESEGKEEGKEEEKKEENTPPPPHGDKTPWQVFMDTLQTEFKASKEWNEGTKAIQSGYDELAQNPALQKAKSAYEATSKTTSDATAAALKSTAKVVGQSATWAWETPVAKVVRKGATAAGSGIEKVTRPVRETEAFKSVTNVIDDGSSSRYGGWIEKEERRKRRAAREAQAVKEGKPLTTAEEDPE
jgi:import inner membrane translocase subunit TIM44